MMTIILAAAIFCAALGLGALFVLIRIAGYLDRQEEERDGAQDWTNEE